MTFEKMLEQTGRAEVNLAPLLVIVGVALASKNSYELDGILDSLFCPAAEL